MQKENLIKLAFSMDIEPAYEMLYRFAQNYAHRLKMKEADESEEFFQCIKYCKDHPQAVKSRMGISGKDLVRIQTWSRYVLNCSDLRTLSLEEMCYVFACCARFCKAKK
ncbi:MAG: hypothetical protein K2J47_02950 [Ruminococcus sp.]|nr:hypothetical protein [Ruminococcus sp.]